MECIFCKIVNKEIPAKIIAENKGAIAFLDVNPMSDGHTVVVPKKHVVDLSHCDSETLHDVFDLVKKVSLIIQDSVLTP
jgi:histidine triad (HIT) family protein